MRFVAAWLFLAVVFCWIFASANSRLLWLHLHWPPHRQRMRRAELCLEAAKHWDNHPFVACEFLAMAYRLCDECGCPADVWPAGVLAIHVGVR